MFSVILHTSRIHSVFVAKDAARRDRTSDLTLTKGVLYH